MFCQGCGYNLTGKENFCPSCGGNAHELVSPQKKDDFHFEFSSKILVGGSILTPDKLQLNQNMVTYQKRNKYLIGVDSVSLKYKDISSVRIDRKLINCNIIISGRGSREIVARNFYIGDAKRIKEIILNNM